VCNNVCGTVFVSAIETEIKRNRLPRANWERARVYPLLLQFLQILRCDEWRLASGKGIRLYKICSNKGRNEFYWRDMRCLFNSCIGRLLCRISAVYSVEYFRCVLCLWCLLYLVQSVNCIWRFQEQFASDVEAVKRLMTDYLDNPYVQAQGLDFTPREVSPERCSLILTLASPSGPRDAGPRMCSLIFTRAWHLSHDW
jgi:hypothetical protein